MHGTHIMVIEWVKVKENVKHISKKSKVKEEIDGKITEKLGIFDGDVDEKEEDAPSNIIR